MRAPPPHRQPVRGPLREAKHVPHAGGRLSQRRRRSVVRVSGGGPTVRADIQHGGQQAAQRAAPLQRGEGRKLAARDAGENLHQVGLRHLERTAQRG